MEAIKLEDLVPEGSEFTLKKTGKTYRLKPITLHDELWLQKTFGDEIEKIFRQIRMKEVCRIVFHQLEEEDKEDFLSREVTFINEEGEKQSVKMGGAELLFALISGHAEKVKIFEALLRTIGISRPLMEKLEADTKAEEAQKKTQDNPTG